MAADSAAMEDAEDMEGVGAEDAEGVASESAVALVARVAANGSRAMGGGGRLGSRCEGWYGRKPQHQHG